MYTPVKWEEIQSRQRRDRQIKEGFLCAYQEYAPGTHMASTASAVDAHGVSFFAQHSTREGLKLGAQKGILKFLVECWADAFSLRGLSRLWRD